MTFEGSIPLSQLVCIVGLLPFLLLGGIWVLGCLRALWYFFHWLRAQSPSTRWLMTMLPFVPVALMVLGTCLNRHSETVLTICGTTFTVLALISIGAIIGISGILHAYPAAAEIIRGLKQLQKWQGILIIGVMLDILISQLLRET